MKRNLILLVLGILLSITLFANLASVNATGTSGCYNGTVNYTCGDTILSGCVMNNNLNSNGTCFTVSIGDITINGNGYKITGNRSGNGVYHNGFNHVTIKNFTITNFNYGIDLESSSNNNISNNNASNNVVGIYLLSSNYNTFINNNANSNEEGWGFQLSGSNNTFINNTANSNVYGFSLWSGSGNNLTGNRACSNNDLDLDEYADASNNSWSSSIYTFSDPINITYFDQLHNCSYVTPVCVGQNYNFSCGDNVNESCVLNGDLTCSGNGLVIAADNVTLNCAAHNIDGSGSYYGVWSGENRNNLTIKNCSILNFTNGIYIDVNTNHSNLVNNRLYNNSNEGISFAGSDNYNVISNNRIYNNGPSSAYGDGIYACSDNGPDLHTTISNNIIYNNGPPAGYTARLVGGIELCESSFNNLTNNTVYNNGNNGISLNSGADNSTFTYNNVSSNGHYGIEISGQCSNDTFNYNWIYNNTMYDFYNDSSSSGPNINLTHNYWGDNCSMKHYGIPGSVLLPYYSDADMTSLETVLHCVFCGESITSSVALINDTVGCDINKNGIKIDAPNIVFDCQGHGILGLDGSTGIKINANNVSVQNCTIAGFNYGIIGTDINDTLVLNNTFYNTAYTMTLNSTTYNYNTSILNNTILNSTENCLYLFRNQNLSIKYNKIYECFDTSAAGILLSSDTGTIASNVINHTRIGIYVISDFYGSIDSNNVSYTRTMGLGNLNIYSIDAAGINVTNNNFYNAVGWGIYIPNMQSNLKIWHNNIYGNSQGGIYNEVFTLEVSNDSEGNYWGHSSCPVFIPGTDSNNLNVKDSYPYNETDGWLSHEPTICDSVPPIASFGANPVDDYVSNNTHIAFDLKCSDDINVSTIQLYTNTIGTWQANYSNSSYTTDTWLNITVDGIPNGLDYKWAVYCNDSGGNENWTDNRTFSVNYTAPTHNPGGGGGGSNNQNTTNQTQENQTFENATNMGNLGTGTETSLGNGESASFNFNNQQHTIKIQALSSEQVTLLIQSNPIQVTINKGEIKQIDLNSDGKNDISITFKGIVNEKANLEIKPIIESVNCEAGYKLVDNKCVKIETDQEKSKTLIWLGVIIIVIIAIVIFILTRKNSYTRKKQKR